MVSDPKMAIHVANMALRLSDKTTFYTNGDHTVAQNLKDAIGSRSRLKVDARKIASLAMVSTEDIEEKSDVLVTLVDGSQVQEGFLVCYGPPHSPLSV
jgi:hypothetical protein